MLAILLELVFQPRFSLPRDLGNFLRVSKAFGLPAAESSPCHHRRVLHFVYQGLSMYVMCMIFSGGCKVLEVEEVEKVVVVE